MKKFLSFWLLLLAFCVPVAMIAQDAQVEIVVGDSTGSNSYLPSYSFYNYSLTQQIYDADEIGMPGTINSIAFFNTGSEKTRSYTVYMVETDKEQFNGSTDWITVTASDMVFTGSVVMAAGTWTVFQLTNPFEYDGVSNLAVIMDDNTGSYSSGMSCVIFDAPSKALRVYSDGTNYDPYNPSSYSGTVMNVTNRIKLGIVPSGEITCFRPSSLTLGDVDQTSASISWVPYAGSSAWEVFCGTEDEDPEYATWISTSDTFYTFNNLSPNVVYKAYVRTVCTGEVSSSRAISFLTPQAPTTVPYSCDFSDANENSQWLMTTSGTNHFVIGEGTSYDGGSDMAMYISNDSIGTYAADAVASYSFAERIIDFGETPANYVLSLDWKASGNLQGTSIYSALIVYLRDADEQTPSGTLPSFVNSYLQYSVLEQDWTHKDIQLDSVSGMKKLLFLTWGYNNAGATQVPAAVDNISITETSCLTPDFTVVPDAYSASVTWDGDPSGSYVVIYRPQGSSSDNNTYVDVVGDNTVLTGLTPATTYYIWVGQICNGDTSVLGFAHSFTTECATIEVTDDNAYTEDFNGITSGIPSCWDNADGTTTTDSYKWNYYETGESGSCVRFNSYNNSNGNTNMLKTPILDLSQVTDPQVSFSYKNASGGDFSVYLSTDSGNTYTTTLATGLTNAAAWTTVSYPLSDLTDVSSVVIVFQGTSNYGSGDAYIYIDNVIVGATPSCPTPTNLTATSTPTDTVILSWNDADGDLWDIIYGPTGFDLNNSDEATIISGVTENPYAVGELAAGVMYDFYIRRDCGGGDVSPWSLIPATAAPYTITMGITGSATVTGCSMTITDDGGPNGNYSNNCDYTLTILPGDPDSIVSISGVFTGESSIDYLSVYSGTTATEENLILKIYSSMNGGTSGSQVTFGPLVSETGPLTLLFHSDVSVVYSGFVATTTCLPAPTCIKPTELATTTIGTDAASITWNENDNSNSYNVAISAQPGFDPDTCSDILTTTTNSYDFTDLTSNTNYFVYVQADCGGDDVSAWSNILSFLTLAGEPAEVPYFQDFSDEDENASWVLINGTQTNKWYIGQPTDETDTVLFISNNGTTAGYTNSSTSNVWAYRDIQFGDGAEFELDVKWKAQGESCCDYLRVYLGPSSSVEAGSVTAPANAVNLSGNLNYNSSYQHLTATLNSSYANTTQRLYFLWHNDGSVGTDPGAVVSEVSITVSNCGRPYNLAVQTLGSSDADLSFSPAMENDNEWDYALCEGNEQPDSAAITGQVTDTLISFTNLTPATTYQLYVRTVCDNDGNYSGWSDPITFTTMCVSYDAPFLEEFTASGIPACWDRYSGAVSSVFTGGTLTPSSLGWVLTSEQAFGQQHIRLNIYGTDRYFWLVTPDIDLSSLTNPAVIFDLALTAYSGGGAITPGNQSDDEFMVIVSTDHGVTWSEANATVWNNTGTGDYTYDDISTTGEEVALSLAQYAGQTVRIAFYGGSTTSNGDNNLHIDNVAVNEMPTCPKPTQVSVSQVTSNEATISWTENGDATSWNIKVNDGTTENTVIANTNPYTLTNLTDATTYTVSIQAICSASDLSDWTASLSFSTTCDALTTFPYTEGFENNGDMPTCWTQEYVTGSLDWLFQNGGNTSSNIDSAHGGSYNAYLYSSSDYVTKLVSPVFDLSNVTDPYVSFWHAQPIWSSDQDELTVYYRTSSTAEWQQLAQYTSSITDWTFDSIALPSPSSTYQIAFEGSTSYGYGITIDDITLNGTSSGPVITDPTVATTAATGLTQTSATLNGTITNPDNVTITAKGFEWKATAGGTYAPVTVTGDNLTYSLTGLTANTSYTYKAFITYNGNTVYGQEMTFTTLPEDVQPCDVPTGLTVGTITHESIAISWDANANVSSWNIQYRPVGGTLSSATSQTNSYTIAGLTPETTYEIQVQAVCENGTSDWTAPVNATTTTGIENHLQNSIVLFPNPAKEYINVQCTMYNVQMVEVIDVYGKLIQTLNVTDNPTSINVSNLASGMYFVRVTTEEGVATKSFVKK